MRMARIKTERGEVIVAPINVILMHPTFWIMPERIRDWTTTMSLEEVVDELNDALCDEPMFPVLPMVPMVPTPEVKE